MKRDLYKKSRLRPDKQIMNIRKHLLRKSNLCALCGKTIDTMKDATIDHIIPVSKGGHSGLTNLQLAHFQCNQDKGNSTTSK